MVEERPDIAVLDQAPEQVAALGDDLGIQDRAVSRGQHRTNRPGEPHLVRGERPAPWHAQRVARPEPPDGQRRRIGSRLDGQPAVCRRHRRRFGVKGGPLEELPQRRLQHAVVERADGGEGGRRTLGS